MIFVNFFLDEWWNEYVRLVCSKTVGTIVDEAHAPKKVFFWFFLVFLVGGLSDLSESELVVKLFIVRRHPLMIIRSCRIGRSVLGAC